METPISEHYPPAPQFSVKVIVTHGHVTMSHVYPNANRRRRLPLCIMMGITVLTER